MADLDRIERVLNEYDRKVELYSRFCESVEHLLRDLLHTSDIRINAVASRPKERDSFERKIKSNSKYVSLETVMDVAGARVITYFEDDVNRVDGIIRGEFEIDPLNSVNKRRSLQADRFGYQSLHLVASLNNQRASLRENHEFAGLKIEIQVRSVLQHAWAEIEHGLGYKGVSAVPVSIKRRFNRLAGLLELADQEFVAVRTELGQLSQDLPACRGEGLTELVEFDIDLPYGAIPTLSDLGDAELVLWVDTNIASRIIASGSLTEVEMHTEDGVSHAGVKRGSQISVSSLAFSNVFPMGPPQKGEVIKLHFSGLRVNAFQLGTTTELAPTTVKAGISIRHKKDDVYSFIEVTGPVDVAVVRPSVQFLVCSPDRQSDFLGMKANGSGQRKEIFFWVQCLVSFVGAFRPGDRERSCSEMSTVQGTRVLFRFNSVPIGARVFVTLRDLAGTSCQPCLQLTEASVDGSGSFRAIKPSTNRPIGGIPTEFAETSMSGTTAFAVWECTHVPRVAAVLSLGVIIDAPLATNVDAMTVNASLAPLSNVDMSSSTDPVPRFGDTSEPERLTRAQRLD